jgi:hypothetical protein
MREGDRGRGMARGVARGGQEEGKRRARGERGRAYFSVEFVDPKAEPSDSIAALYGGKVGPDAGHPVAGEESRC